MIRIGVVEFDTVYGAEGETEKVMIDYGMLTIKFLIGITVGFILVCLTFAKAAYFAHDAGLVNRKKLTLVGVAFAVWAGLMVFVFSTVSPMVHLGDGSERATKNVLLGK
jgi:hypothetical protein